MTTRIGDFTVISTQNVDLSQITPEMKKTGDFYEGEDLKFWGIPNIEEAIDEALKKGNGNVMLDAVLYSKIGFFKSGYKVKGRVIEAR
jgi:hypothetical protein